MDVIYIVLFDDLRNIFFIEWCEFQSGISGLFLTNNESVCILQYDYIFVAQKRNTPLQMSTRRRGASGLVLGH